MPDKTTGWRPIETAPKDGTDVLLFRRLPWDPMPRPIVAGYFGTTEDCGWAAYDDPDKWIDGEVTHWMPLPEPPL